MAVFNDLGKKLGALGQSVKRSTENIQAVARLNNEISEEEGKLNKACHRIGLLFIERFGTDCPEEFLPLVNDALAAKDAIAQRTAEKARLKAESEDESVFRCPSCNAVIKASGNFCAKCGARLS